MSGNYSLCFYLMVQRCLSSCMMDENRPNVRRHYREIGRIRFGLRKGENNLSHFWSLRAEIDFYWAFTSLGFNILKLYSQKCGPTRALSNLPLRLPEVFTDGPEGTLHVNPTQINPLNLLWAQFDFFGGLFQESWASDLSRVREFLMSYMRGGPQPEPMLQLDEVIHLWSAQK